MSDNKEIKWDVPLSQEELMAFARKGIEKLEEKVNEDRIAILRLSDPTIRADSYRIAEERTQYLEVMKRRLDHQMRGVYRERKIDKEKRV